jgi:isopentenyl-diphosphate Delta-isomerase
MFPLFFCFSCYLYLMLPEKVILVDNEDNPIGEMDKLEAHKKGVLHRAFSIFIFNSKKELLIQKRNRNKYHCGGMWSNTCCSHPTLHESTIDAAHRRLKEEMGFDCPILNIFSFIYKVDLDHQLSEHEYDHVYWGIYKGNPKINKNEVSDWSYVSLQELRKLMKDAPGDFTPWLHLSLDRVEKKTNEYFNKLNLSPL